MFKYKDQHVTGQRVNTRCQNLLKWVYKRVDAAKGKYRMAQKALTILGARLGEVGWMVRLLPLKDKDVRPLRDMEPELQKKMKKWKEKEKKQKGEGYIELSWIWKVVGVSSDEGDESLQEQKDFSWLLTNAGHISSTPNLMVSGVGNSYVVVRGGANVVGRNVPSFGLFLMACRLVVRACCDEPTRPFQRESRRRRCLCLQASPSLDGPMLKI